ncbi:MAG: hypothetical protein ABJE10_08410 [bacterium]
MMRTLSRVAVVFLVLACAAHTHSDTDRAPVIERLSPDSVIVAPGSVIEITVIGSGFHRGAESGNTVRFAQSTLRGVRANADGTRIVFVVPDALDSGGEAPPSRVITGSYPVQVETASGKSNVLMLKVYR